MNKFTIAMLCFAVGPLNGNLHANKTEQQRDIIIKIALTRNAALRDTIKRDFSVSWHTHDDSHPTVVQIMADTIEFTLVTNTENSVTNTQNTITSIQNTIANTQCCSEDDCCFHSCFDTPDEPMYTAYEQYSFGDTHADDLDNFMDDYAYDMDRLEAAPKNWSTWMACKGTLQAVYASIAAKLTQLRNAAMNVC